MQSLILILTLVLMVFWHKPPAHGAQAELHAECRITGVLVSTQERTEQLFPNMLAGPKPVSTHTYLDATMTVTDATTSIDEGYNNCGEKQGTHVFQIRDDWVDWINSQAPGLCLMAKNRLSGDEFSFGDWLFAIEAMPESTCR
ncbi:MAG: hypothetical protein AAF213_13705 [Pseudomonadota bacterium]